MQQLLYVYGITDIDIGMEMLMAEDLYCVPMVSVFALVEQVLPADFGEAHIQQNLENPAWLTKKVHKHEQVLQLAMQKATVIPFKFGTVFQHMENLSNSLAHLHHTFTQQLSALQGKKEWGLKIYTQRELLAIQAEKQPAVAQILAEITNASTGKAFLLKKKKQQLMQDAILQEGVAITKWVLESVKKKSWDFQQGRLLSKHAHGKEADLLLNLSVLVPTAEEKAFFEWVNHLGLQLQEKGAFTEQSGPWPPYHFTNLT